MKKDISMKTIDSVCLRKRILFISLFFVLFLSPLHSQSDEWNRIYNAVKENDFDEVTKCLEDGINPNIRKDNNSSTIMATAAYFGNMDIINALVAAGSELHSKSASGFTPFMNAIRGKHIETVQFFVENGANINTRTNINMSPYMFAYVSGSEEIINYLNTLEIDTQLAYKIVVTTSMSTAYSSYVEVPFFDVLNVFQITTDTVDEVFDANDLMSKAYPAIVYYKNGENYINVRYLTGEWAFGVQLHGDVQSNRKIEVRVLDLKERTVWSQTDSGAAATIVIRSSDF